ncbi:MAG: hypothetical protein K0R65_1274 [Crocinitomicaceae bacterium]|nr:hypothetical protein [Crocinitomicaceae bacterium]
MKKLVLGSVALLSIGTLIVLGCQKESPAILNGNPVTENQKEKPGPNGQDKAEGSSSCSVSCYWGSCSVTCRGGKNGSLGAATCNCIGIGPFGILGSVASCSCGHLGISIRGLHVGPEIIFDEVNIENFKFLKELIEEFENAKINRLKSSLNRLILEAENPDGKVRSEHFNRFLDDLATIEFDDAAYIRPHLLKRAEACGREL